MAQTISRAFEQVMVVYVCLYLRPQAYSAPRWRSSSAERDRRHGRRGGSRGRFQTARPSRDRPERSRKSSLPGRNSGQENEPSSRQSGHFDSFGDSAGRRHCEQTRPAQPLYNQQGAIVAPTATHQSGDIVRDNFRRAVRHTHLLQVGPVGKHERPRVGRPESWVSETAGAHGFWCELFRRRSAPPPRSRPSP